LPNAERRTPHAASALKPYSSERRGSYSSWGGDHVSSAANSMCSGCALFSQSRMDRPFPNTMNTTDILHPADGDRFVIVKQEGEIRIEKQ
jgi:hypothetical protein